MAQAAGVPDAAPSPDARPSVRVGIERPATRALLLLAAGAVVGALVVMILGWPRGEAIPAVTAPPLVAAATTDGSQMLGAATPSATNDAGTVVVDVAGLVKRPGVVELPVGSRVIDAIEAAGGLRSRGDTTGLNLAQVLVDGEQILVAVPAQQLLPPAARATSPPTTSGPSVVDINTATLELLDTLPGIGPVLAQAIIDWRTQNGSFASIEQLQEVSGIGSVTFADLQALVRV
jgi:competence protein ComEA